MLCAFRCDVSGTGDLRGLVATRLEPSAPFHQAFGKQRPAARIELPVRFELLPSQCDPDRFLRCNGQLNALDSTVRSATERLKRLRTAQQPSPPN